MSDSEAITRLNAALEGRYRIEHELGEGGMATVYLADDLKHERKVALKVLKPELAAVVGAERFLTEIKTTANLQHPHILPLFDSGEADGFLFFVMPYIEGETLRDRLEREKQLPVDEAVRIATDVAEALHSAHERGVIHRDVKPANILLSKGRPLVADFGIALAVSTAGGSRLTETGLSVGSPFYMSPEQATGDREISAHSDVYALGCVLYEMLVGEPPYVGNTAQAVLGKILTEKPRAPTAVRPVIPPHVEGTVLKALEKLPADRFRSAEAFVQAITDPSFRYGELSETAAAQSGSGLWKYLAIASTGVAVVLGGMAIRGSPESNAEPVVRFQVTANDDLILNTDAGLNFDLSPDGSRLAFVASLAGAPEQIWLRHMDELTPVAVAGTEFSRNVRFSPEGTSIAFSSRGALKTVSLDGQPAQTIVSESVLDGGGGIAWGDDGHLYFRREGAGIWRVAENGGEAEEITALAAGETAHSWPDALPNGEGVLFTRVLGIPQESRIALWSMITGEIVDLGPGTTARYARSGHLISTTSDGALVAAIFDPGRSPALGDARTMLQGVQVNIGSASYFTISSTGVLSYVRGAGQGGGVPRWLRQDGAFESDCPGGPCELGELTSQQGLFANPALSPDAQRIAFEFRLLGAARNDIWILDLETRTYAPLTFEGNNARPIWSPDGDDVGFVSDRGGAFAFYSRPSNFGGEPRLILEAPAGGEILDAVWTPDGQSLVYRQTSERQADTPEASRNSDILRVALDPRGEPFPVAATRFTEGSPSVSPDGRWVAFSSDVSGRREVFVAPLDGSGGRIPVSVNGGSVPVWTADGTGIFYERSDVNNVNWLVADVRTDPDFAVVGRRQLMSNANFMSSQRVHANYDVTADGQHLVVISVRFADVGSRPVIVTNWFEELRERLGN